MIEKERTATQPTHPVLPFFDATTSADAMPIAPQTEEIPLEASVIAPPPVVPEEPPPLSVSALSLALKRTLETTYGQVRVRGEISGLKLHSSGHCYFALKDEQAVLDAVCWRGTGGRLTCKPADGLEVIATGKITSYPGRSKYQIVVEDLQLTGEGSLLKVMEERKRRLLAEGFFDPARKQELPAFPKSIGLITSPTGAVIQDILHRLRDRFPLQVYLWPVVVQGDQAAPQICEALQGFERLAVNGELRPDVLIVARGGGSLEDLWAFNEEAVVRAVAACSIPVISAVGHETDTTLIDYVADRRAPTPTAAAEMAVPERRLLQQRVQSAAGRLQAMAHRSLETAALRVSFIQKRFPVADALLGPHQQRLDDLHGKLLRSMERRLEMFQRTWERLKEALRKPDGRLELAQLQLERRIQSFRQGFRFCLQRKVQRFQMAVKLLESVSYTKTLERGFCFLTSPNGSAVYARASAVGPGSMVSIHFADGKLDAEVLPLSEKMLPNKH